MKQKYKRLAKILEKLYRGEKLTISSLAKEFHTSTKTIQRDLKEKLKSKFLVREGNTFSLRIACKKQRDAFVLDILENIAQNIGGTFKDDVFEILDKYRSHSNSFETPLLDMTHKEKEILQIQKAITMRNYLTFLYKGEIQTKIQPLRLQVIKNSIFFSAIKNQELHFFKLDEISQCRLSRQKFTPQQAVQNIEVQNKQKVSLFVFSQASQYAQNLIWGEKQEIIKDKDGSLIIEFLCSNEDALIMEIFSQLPHIVVLEPQSLKERIEKKILAYIKKQ